MAAKPAAKNDGFSILLLIGAILILLSLYFNITTSRQLTARGGLAVGQQAPLIQAEGWMQNPSDQPISYEGKLTVINAWATWCAPCYHHAPEIVELRNQFADDPEVQFLSMTSNNSEQLEIIEKWLAETGWDWPNAYGAEQAFFDFEARYIPGMWIVDPSGKIIWNRASSEDPHHVLQETLQAMHVVNSTQ